MRRGWISGELLAAPGQRQGYDGLQRREENSRVSTAPSISSGEEEEGWLEAGAASVRSSGVRRRRIPARNGRTIGSLDAQDHGEEGKAREGTRRSPRAPELAIGGGGVCRLAGQNLSIPAASSSGEKRGNREEGKGVL
jgi:hypothetical protein